MRAGSAGFRISASGSVSSTTHATTTSAAVTPTRSPTMPNSGGASAPAPIEPV